MDERLPRWTVVGAALLACVAGMVNVVGYLGFEYQALSHLTGTTSLLGAALVHGDPGSAAHLLAVVLAFCAGATVSGLVLHDDALRLGQRYGVALTLESILLVAAVPVFHVAPVLGALLAAMACGLQNAMATTYSGALVRTTHLSGMFTDLGLGLGHRLRGRPVPARRLALSALVIAGFFAGGLGGAWLFSRIGYHALLLPAALTGATGLAYLAYRRWRRVSARPRG